MELERTKSYSQEEVLAIIKSQQATIDDYVVRTHFKIFKITEGPLFSQFERRFNNIIFNNFAAISHFLTVVLFKPKAAETLQREISSVKYFSCIYPNKLVVNPPVFLQYFTRTSGLEQRLLGFTTLAPEVLSEAGVMEKVVGYCGDFCYRDLPTSYSGSAVVYYFYLRRIRRLFENYENTHYVPPSAYSFIITETHLLGEVVLEVDSTYARAAKYLKPLIRELGSHFENCSWFLLTEPIDPDEIHQSFHTIKKTRSCESCRELLEEVKTINCLVTTIPLLDIVRVESKWLMVLKESRKVRDVEDESFQRIEGVIRDIMKNVAPESVVNGLGGFFSDRLEEIKAHMEAFKVPLFHD